MAPRIFVAFITALGICVYAGARVETQTSPGTPDIAAALLEEVRALRVTIETLASAGASGQLALGRLQLQEQRLNGAIGKLDLVRERLATVQREAAQEREDLAQLESMLRDNPSLVTMHHSVGEPMRDREAAEEMLKFKRSQIAAMNADSQRLTIEEGTLANDVAVEQARWWEAHRRLEDIEHRLMRPGARAGSR
jgi:hypothetical protein